MVGWVLGDHLLLRDFGPYRIIFMSVCCCNCYHGNIYHIKVQYFGPYIFYVMVGW
jgi:hypothetical protein